MQGYTGKHQGLSLTRQKEQGKHGQEPLLWFPGEGPCSRASKLRICWCE